jgi:UDP-glucose 4-epimerase
MDLKRVLITGKNSYVGINVEKWLMKEPDEFYVESISVRDDSWKDFNFSKFDVVFHVAGIAHIKEKKNRDLYFKVNRDLAFKVAKNAKDSGVKQFIFLSSMSVYGINTGIISKDTKENPNTAYGKSKFEAEKIIHSLQSDSFKVTIVRPPMIYGNGCKGNYSKISKFAKIIPIFPKIDNSRSMIYIDNLSEFIKLIIEECYFGLFFPQNSEYINTSNMVKMISELNGKSIKLTKIFNIFLNFLFVGFHNKVFGNLVYEKEMSKLSIDYNCYDFDESMRKSEKKL